MPSLEMLLVICMWVDMLFLDKCSENLSLEFRIKFPYKVIDIYFFSRKNNNENINTSPFPYLLSYQSLAIISPRLRLDMEKVMY